VVLSGGVFQNRRLLEATAAELARDGLQVLIPERLPPNDGGISFGQAAIAAARSGPAAIAAAHVARAAP
jgi:hydrogenase maturation protein HypF